ncbi:PP2C family protein-serine/threonine phosphatase [Streptomyces sp. BK239]|uniref:PP2C family protein-serine/threonine phosphatase n=1 Tax=Streptomyces sp. BK239 TaxID=2512155 RepID=UPI0010D5FE99|nr:GAF domain-containing SpoIIE family protein phosphatase [Streptomyces sp. BK239]RZU25520.1 sigma-B regulation protein RsbU (phosphoserine phosphatase) [Streptomyces sp. BK239]
MPEQASASEEGATDKRLHLVPDEVVEVGRMEAVRRYDILDTPPDGAFDRVAALAARLFDVPVATVTIVDEDRIWFKAAHGLDGVSEIGRDPGLCGSAVLRDDALVIPDTLLDDVACGNPLVTGPLGVRFYAAAPITTTDGHKLGTVNVLDTKPRSITSEQTATLTDLAAIVMDEMELRLSALRTVRQEQRAAEAERAAREQAERDKAAIASFASTLQRTLLPPALPTVPGLELACHYHTASVHDVGGDFYDVFPLPAGKWGLFLGDVCGKGAEAATITSLARYTLRASAQHTDDPVAVLEALNSALLADVWAGSRFCTAFFATLTPDAAGGFTVDLATGGHPPAYHLSPTSPQARPATHTRVEAVSPKGGMLIGAFRGARFASTTLHLAPGQALLLYTDGLTEARTSTDTMLGDEGLTAFLTARPASCGAAQLVQDTVGLLDALPEGASDDVALLALSVPAPDQAAAATGAGCTAHTTAAPAGEED